MEYQTLYPQLHKRIKKLCELAYIIKFQNYANAFIICLNANLNIRTTAVYFNSPISSKGGLLTSLC